MRRPTITHRYPLKYVLQWLALIVFVVFILTVIFGSSAGSQKREVPFDHEQCQYPARSTNPPAGCDNSDPACGEIIKGAEQCPADKTTTTPLETQKPMSQNIEHEVFTEVAGK